MRYEHLGQSKVSFNESSFFDFDLLGMLGNAKLEKSIIEIVSASVGFKYSPKHIIETISFVMTDSTAHN